MAGLHCLRLERVYCLWSFGYHVSVAASRFIPSISL